MYIIHVIPPTEPMRVPLLFQIMSICIFMRVLLYATLSVLLPHDAAKTAISWEKAQQQRLAGAASLN